MVVLVPCTCQAHATTIRMESYATRRYSTTQSVQYVNLILRVDPSFLGFHNVGLPSRQHFIDSVGHVAEGEPRLLDEVGDHSARCTTDASWALLGDAEQVHCSFSGGPIGGLR